MVQNPPTVPVPAEAVAVELTGRRGQHMAQQAPAEAAAEALARFPTLVFPHSKTPLFEIPVAQRVMLTQEQRYLLIPAPAEMAGLEARAEQVLRGVSSSIMVWQKRSKRVQLSARIISSAWTSTDV